jgi:O-antigen ligase
MSKYVLMLSKGSYGLLLLVCASLPFSILVNSYLIVITIITCLFYSFFNGLEKREGNKYYALLIVMYLLNLFSFSTSQNFKPVLTDLEQKIPLLTFPIIFLLGPKLSDNKIRTILITFVCSVAIVSLLSFRNGFYWGYRDEALYDNLLIRHPYLAMYSVLCFFFCVEIIPETKAKLVRWFFILLAIFFVFFLVTLFAKMSLVTFIILVFLYGVFKLYHNKKKNLAFIVVLLLILAMVYAGGMNQTGRELVKKIFSFTNLEFNEYNPTIVNSLNLRMIHWSCSFDILFSQKNWLWGAGTGDAQVLLNECYANKIGAGSFLVKDNFNSHNQFFTFWLDLGIGPLLFFLFHFVAILWLYIKNKDLLAIVFTVGILFFCITESIFEVQKGIVFYSLFQSMFLSRQF